VKSIIVPCTVAVLIGLIQAILLTYCWVYIATYNPLPIWLVYSHITGALNHVVVGFVDFAINVLLCLPAGYAICKLRPRKLGVYVPLAVVPVFLWAYWPVLGPVLGESWLAYIPRALSVLLMLPVAVLFLRRVTASA
jgi:hypothetical protein